MSKIDFPINVFPDVERDAFSKYTKKNVTEDYIYENLKLHGWTCYKPFVDTGIDIIATKEKEKGYRIYRYIQVKTRELSTTDTFGYTLKPKDFRVDPRHFFLFFCDTVNEIILIGMYDYMKLFYENNEMGINHFANPTFRNNNNKLNSLKYAESRWSWTYRSLEGMKTVFFDKWVNKNGLNKMEETYIDENLHEMSEEIAKMKNEMFYKINKTTSNSQLLNGKEGIINRKMKEMQSISPEEYINMYNKIEDNFKKENEDLYASHERYIYSCKKNFDNMFVKNGENYEYE